MANDPGQTRRLPVVLGLLTLVTLTWAGAWHWVLYAQLTTHQPVAWFGGSAWAHGLWFTGALGGTLVCHELGHVWACRKHRLTFDGPYFLPAPFALLGTGGAFIRLTRPYMTRTQMIEVGSAGPVFGFSWAVLCALVGLRWSVPYADGSATNLVRFGTPHVMTWLSPSPDLILHPLAAGAWLGCLVTMVNLLPFEHFDGGTILHGIWPKGARLASIGMFGVAYLLSAGSLHGHLTWLIAAAVAMIALLATGFQPTPPVQPLPRSSYGWVLLAVLCLVASWTAL